MQSNKLDFEAGNQSLSVPNAKQLHLIPKFAEVAIREHRENNYCSYSRTIIVS